MNETDKYVNSIIYKSLILLSVESFIIIFFKDFLPILFGLLLGGFFSILFFKIIYLNILHAIEITEGKAKRFITVNYIIRYIISGLVLFIAAKSDYLNIYSCFLGFLTIKLTLYFNNLIFILLKKKE